MSPIWSRISSELSSSVSVSMSDSKSSASDEMTGKSHGLNDCDRRTSMEPLEVPSTNFRTPIISFSSSAVITTVPVRPLVVRMSSLNRRHYRDQTNCHQRSLNQGLSHQKLV
eukprot:UN27145